MEGLTAGRIVHYVLPDGHHEGEHRPAIVIKVWGVQPELMESPCVQLAVFADGTNDYPGLASAPVENPCMPVVWRTSVPYSEAPEPNTWHWIERA